MHNILSNGELVQFAIASNDTGVDSKSLDHWQRSVRADEIKKLFKDYPPHLNKAVDDCASLATLRIGQHHGHGSGAGISVEDSLILSTLLGRAGTPTEALTALKVYDGVRRPRTQRIVESSRVTGDMLTGRHAETGLDPKKFESFVSRWDFIIDFDMEYHRDEALQMMEAELRGESTL
ncbi:hypothetical protein Hte_008617 [Hypoxylon texense]